MNMERDEEGWLQRGLKALVGWNSAEATSDRLICLASRQFLVGTTPEDQSWPSRYSIFTFRFNALENRIWKWHHEEEPMQSYVWCPTSSICLSGTLLIFCSINTILSPEAPDQFPGAASASAVSCSSCQRFEMWKCFSISEQVSLEKICLLIHESSGTEVNTRTYTLLLHEEWKRWNTGKEKAYSFDNRGRGRRYGAFLTPSSA